MDEKYTATNNDNTTDFRIEPKDFLFECSNNENFNEIINSGNFIFIDGRLIINDAKYVAENEQGVFYLTDHAKNHLSECCLTLAKSRHIDANVNAIQDKMQELMHITSNRVLSTLHCVVSCT